jgi:hypothetical protein
MSSDLIGGYLTFYLNQPINWADFRLDALLADTMLTKLYTTGPNSNKQQKKIYTGSLQSMATVTYLENGSLEILEIWYGVKSI